MDARGGRIGVGGDHDDEIPPPPGGGGASLIVARDGGERDAGDGRARGSGSVAGALVVHERADAGDDAHVSAQRRDGERGSVGGPREARDDASASAPSARLGGIRGDHLVRAEEALEVVLVAEGSDDATGRDSELGAARGGGEAWAGGVVVVRADGARGCRADRGRYEAARGGRRAAGETKRAAG